MRLTDWLGIVFIGWCFASVLAATVYSALAMWRDVLRGEENEDD